MIQSDKNKKIVVVDSNKIPVSDNACPASSLSDNEGKWLCHTVINLRSVDSQGADSRTSKGITFINTFYNKKITVYK